METGNSSSFISREKIDQAASWVSATVSTAFFSSLERWSCVNVATTDSDSDEDEAKDRPLTLTNHNDPPNDVAKLPIVDFPSLTGRPSYIDRSVFPKMRAPFYTTDQSVYPNVIALLRS